MEAVFFERLAERCRSFLLSVDTPSARAQLEVWIAEFEAQAEALASAQARGSPLGHGGDALPPMWNGAGRLQR